jgi:hypothetical protein
MRGYEHYNAPAFDAATAQLRAAGYEVISPVEMDRAAGFDHATMTATPAGQNAVALVLTWGKPS